MFLAGDFSALHPILGTVKADHQQETLPSEFPVAPNLVGIPPIVHYLIF